METGKQLKEHGQQRALTHAGMAWRDRALLLLGRFVRTGPGFNRTFAFEDFRLWALDNGLESPPSHQSWGALTKAALKDEIIRPTGQFAPAKSPSTRAHYVRLYRAQEGEA